VLRSDLRISPKACLLTLIMIIADLFLAKRSVTRIIYDFTDIPEDQFTSARAAGRRSAYFLVNFQIDIQVATNVQVWVTCNGNEMTRIPLSY
jgi:hypothetical protein